jgi:Protein of unknown function (DUF3551)
VKLFRRVAIAFSLTIFFTGLSTLPRTAAAATMYEYCKRDVISYMLSCNFESLAQCQAMSSGIGGDCLRNPSLATSSAFAYAPVGPWKKRRAK